MIKSSLSPLSLSSLLEGGAGGERAIRTREACLTFEDCAGKTSLGGWFERLEGRSVVLLAGDQLKTAATLIDLDGWARRLILCPPDLEARHLDAIIRDAEADALIYDAERKAPIGAGLTLVAPCALPLRRHSVTPTRRYATEWGLLTSGTTGDPKIVVHTLATLMGAIPREQAQRSIQH